MNNSHHLEREELMAYVDGELRLEFVAGAASHLEHCAECGAAVTDLHELSRHLASWKAEARPLEMSAALGSAVDAHISHRQKPAGAHKQSFRQILGTRRLIWAGGTAFAVLLLAALIGPKITSKLTQAKHTASGGVAFQSMKSSPATIKTPQPLASNQSHGTVTSMNFSSTSESMAFDSTGSMSTGSIAFDSKGLTGSLEKLNPSEQAKPSGPMIVRTAQLSLVAKDFAKARAGAEEILKRHGGYVGQLNVNAPVNAARTLTAVFRVPSPHLDAALSELKALGRVTSESQNGEEVTQQYVDLEARLANARHTEQRLSDLLRDRTGRLSDVLEFEKEIDRVRGEIEDMEAQRKLLAKQVNYATLNATLIEEYGAMLQLTPPSTSTRVRNAAVDGYEALAGGIVSVLLFLLSAGPSLLVWGAIIFFAGRLIWKRVRGRIA